MGGIFNHLRNIGNIEPISVRPFPWNLRPQGMQLPYLCKFSFIFIIHRWNYVNVFR